MLEQSAVGRGLSVVEFVDDHYIVEVRRQAGEIECIQRLNRGEDVLADLRTLTSYEQLAEASVPQDVAENSQALSKNLLTVCDEEQPRPPPILG
jgi:hypothetical protein